MTQRCTLVYSIVGLAVQFGTLGTYDTLLGSIGRTDRTREVRITPKIG